MENSNNSMTDHEQIADFGARIDRAVAMAGSAAPDLALGVTREGGTYLVTARQADGSGAPAHLYLSVWDGGFYKAGAIYAYICELCLKARNNQEKGTK